MKVGDNMELKEKLFLNWSNKVDEFEIIEKISDYGYLVTKEEKKKIINSKGNIEFITKKVYNILLKSRMLSCDEWFDKYIFDEYGTCIYAVLRTASEYEGVKNACSYISSNEETLESKIIYKYGAINKFGENLVDPIYDGLAFGTEDTLVAVHKGNLGFVDALTGKQITPIIFPHVSHFSEGLAEVEWNGLSGYVDRNKHMTNPMNPWEYAIVPKYTQAGDFENGVAEVEYDGDKRYLNKDGVFITKETARLLKKDI